MVSTSEKSKDKVMIWNLHSACASARSCMRELLSFISAKVEHSGENIYSEVVGCNLLLKTQSHSIYVEVKRIVQDEIIIYHLQLTLNHSVLDDESS